MGLRETPPLPPRDSRSRPSVCAATQLWFPISFGPWDRRCLLGLARSWHRAIGAAGPCRTAPVSAWKCPVLASEQQLFNPSKMSVHVKEEGCSSVHTSYREERGGYRTLL